MTESDVHSESKQESGFGRELRLEADEVTFIMERRNKLRLFNPKAVYFYRHVSLPKWHCICHGLSVIFHVLFMIGFFLWWWLSSYVAVIGVGRVFNVTLLEILAVVVTIIYLYRACEHLLGLNGLQATKTYKLAMLANGFNAALLTYITVNLILLGIAMIWLILLGAPFVRELFTIENEKYLDFAVIYNLCLLLWIVNINFQWFYKDTQ